MSVLYNPHPPVQTVNTSTFDYAKYPFEHISVKLDEGVLILTLNRPEKHNAFTNVMMHSIVFCMELADVDDRVKVVVMTGAGKSYCAGADLSGDVFGADAKIQYKDHRDGGGQAAMSVLRCRKLVIAAVNGNAIGVGITMILPADIRIVAESAKLALPFAKRGINSEAMSGYILPRLVGHAHALEIAMTGDIYSPSAPCFASMFKSILPADQVLPTALALAKRLSKENSPISMALNKALVWRAPDSPEATHLLDSMCISATSASPDAQEGVQSFLQKRPAQFPGKMADLDRFGFYPWWNTVDVMGKKIRGGPQVDRAKL